MQLPPDALSCNSVNFSVVPRPLKKCTTPPELQEWVPRVRTRLKNEGEGHPVVNTNNQDQGIVNARMRGKLPDGAALAQ